MAEPVLARPFPAQADPPRSPAETLPTMYDLPSEDPEEPGLPDEFHLIQPQLLRETFRPPDVPPEEVFVASDLNLYYDVRHMLWHKRPDWFAVLGVDRLYQQKDLRMSYVIWQEGVSPTIAVELLSPGTEREDLGTGPREVGTPPPKWEVYERILRVPYYLVYSRYTNELRVFELLGGRYRTAKLRDRRFWMETIRLGVGLWEGEYQGVQGRWMRWYDEGGEWIPTPLEEEWQRAEKERQRAEKERQRAEQLAARLRDLGIDPEA